jgi:catechol 2,3-dioxygenase-like lactoylglutathione lyase family enzyme
MMPNGFSAGPIDHVELFVHDRYEAADWYRQALGLEIVGDVEDWAAAEGGPLMISSDGGNTMLALFEGEPRGSRATAGHHRVAFRVDGPTFLRFLKRLKRFPVFDEEGHESASVRVKVTTGRTRRTSAILTVTATRSQPTTTKR